MTPQELAQAVLDHRNAFDDAFVEEVAMRLSEMKPQDYQDFAGTVVGIFREANEQEQLSVFNQKIANLPAFKRVTEAYWAWRRKNNEAKAAAAETPSTPDDANEG